MSTGWPILLVCFTIALVFFMLGWSVRGAVKEIDGPTVSFDGEDGPR